MKYKPIGDGILLEKMVMDDHTSGGIVLPQTAVDKIKKGKVIEVGDGADDLKIFVKPGDIVLYFCQRELPIDDYILIGQRDIYVICIDDGIDHKKYIVEPDKHVVASIPLHIKSLN